MEDHCRLPHQSLKCRKKGTRNCSGCQGRPQQSIPATCHADVIFRMQVLETGTGSILLLFREKANCSIEDTRGRPCAKPNVTIGRHAYDSGPESTGTSQW